VEVRVQGEGGFWDPFNPKDTPPPLNSGEQMVSDARYRWMRNGGHANRAAQIF
jgi:hypothetical protein